MKLICGIFILGLMGTSIVRANDVVTPNELTLSTEWGRPDVKLKLNFNPVTTRNEVKRGRIEFDCAHGNLNRILSDSASGFIGVGTYTQEGGPVSPHPQGRTQAAKYFGYAFGNNKLNLIIVLASDPEHPMTFSLQRNLKTVFHKCL